MSTCNNLSRDASKRGFTLVEAVVASTIILGVVLGVAAAMHSYRVLSRVSPTTVKAAYLGEEGLEVMKFLRDSSWTGNIASMTPGTTYYLTFNGSSWATSTSVSLIDSIYDRRVTVENVYRDASSNIVENGGTLDPNTRKVTVTMVWSDGTNTFTKPLTTYIANLYAN